jgi:hypothetical protein
VGVSSRFLADKFPMANVTVSFDGWIEIALSTLCKKNPYAWYVHGLWWKCLFQGLDMSPYFLAVAQHKEKRGTTRKNPIKWMHANGEDTGLPSKSFDLVSISYVVCRFLLLFSPLNSENARINFYLYIYIY